MSRKRAFTLLELIVAMGIMVLVAATLTAAIGAAFSLKKSADAAVEATRDTEVVGDIFVSELSNTLIPNANTMPDATTGVVPTPGVDIPGYYMNGAFYGETGIVTFYTSGTEPRGDVQGDVRYVEFAVTQAQDGTSCFVRRQRVNLLEDTPTDPQEEILVKNVIDAQFQYFDGTAWQAQWDTTQMENRLPFAVSLQLTLAPLQDGGPSRIIKRFALLNMAEKTNADADAADAAAAGTTGTTGGGAP